MVDTLGLSSQNIVSLLLDFAPKEELQDLGLTSASRDKWEEILDSERRTTEGNLYVIEMSALALRYATRKRPNKKHPNIRLEADLFTLRRLVETTKTEEFTKLEDIFGELKKSAERKRTAKSTGRINAEKRAAKDAVVKKAEALWQEDIAQEIRIGEMTEIIWSWMADDQTLWPQRPETLRKLRPWLTPAAAKFPHTQKPGPTKPR